MISDAVNAAAGVAETALEADYPWLALPIVKQLFEALFGYIAGKISDQLQNVATFTVIDIQVGSEESGISQALTNLIAAEKTGNAQQIQAAIAAYQAAQSALVNDDGSAPAS